MDKYTSEELLHKITTPNKLEHPYRFNIISKVISEFVISKCSFYNSISISTHIDNCAIFEIDFTAALLRDCVISNTVFINCNFNKTEFEGNSAFKNCMFYNCSFSSMCSPSVINDVLFNTCNLMGLYWLNSYELKNIELYDCQNLPTYQSDNNIEQIEKQEFVHILNKGNIENSFIWSRFKEYLVELEKNKPEFGVWSLLKF